MSDDKLLQCRARPWMVVVLVLVLLVWSAGARAEWQHVGDPGEPFDMAGTGTVLLCPIDLTPPNSGACSIHGQTTEPFEVVDCPGGSNCWYWHDADGPYVLDPPPDPPPPTLTLEEQQAVDVYEIWLLGLVACAAVYCAKAFIQRLVMPQ